MRSKRSMLYAVLLLTLLARVLATAELDSAGVQQELPGFPGEHFGAALAISGNYALVGQPGGVVNGVMMGRVLVYEYQEGRWLNVAQWTPRGINLQQARFGVSVALDGPSAFVGAEGENGARGALYLFERRNGLWQYRDKYTPSNARPKMYFGHAVAVSNGRALVGAPGAGEDQTQPGVVYAVPTRLGVWVLPKSRPFMASSRRAMDGFGTSLAMHGSLALVGAPGYAGQNDAGAVYVLELDRGLWHEVAQLQASDGRPGESFGSALALHGEEVVVGAPGHAGQGAVYVFQRQTPDWTLTEVQKLMASDGESGDHFGAAVALVDGQLLSGAYGRDVQNQEMAGVVYGYTRQGHSWSAVAPIVAPQPVARAHFGYALALSEEHVLLGAPGLFGQPPGRVYTYGVQQSNNTLPIITSVPHSTALVDSAYVYDVEATDVDGDALTYRLSSAPTGMVIEPLTGQITWTPTIPGEVTVGVEVSDVHGGKATQTYRLVVSLPNQAPQITSTPETRTAIEPVIPLLSISDAHLAHSTVTLNGQPYVPGTPITAAGNYVLTVTATDVAGNTSLKTVHFTLRRPSVP